MTQDHVGECVAGCDTTVLLTQAGMSEERAPRVLLTQRGMSEESEESLPSGVETPGRRGRGTNPTPRIDPGRAIPRLLAARAVALRPADRPSHNHDLVDPVWIAPDALPARALVRPVAGFSPPGFWGSAFRVLA